MYGLKQINEELHEIGIQKTFVSDDFKIVDADGKGAVLLDEAVYFFL
eukprot:gene13460-12306_t